MSSPDLHDLSMLDLFRIETESQAEVLTAGLLALERVPTAADQLESCMRAAHSLKGAARIVGRDAAVKVAHVMEDCFVSAQQGRLVLRQQQIDLLLQGVDLLSRVAKTPEVEAESWAGAKKAEVETLVAALRQLSGENTLAANPTPSSVAAVSVEPAVSSLTTEKADRVLRVTADNLNRLLALAGESLVESRWLQPFAESLLRLKRQHHDLARSLDTLRATLPEAAHHAALHRAQADAQSRALECHQSLSQRLIELESFDQRSSNLSHRLYNEALAVRMRPFADGIQGFPRLVRDVGRTLGKSARLEIVGESTAVDRDILEKLEAPLGHLLRNAVDHGIDSPEERAAAGKPVEGLVRLEARHSAGMLVITVTDDGRGVDLGRLRQTIVARNLTNAETAQTLSEAELLEFLFLPGFTLRETVTEISGRGVGLDVVQTMIKAVRGSVRVTSQPGKGTRFHLQLPLTLSVIRTLLASIGGEPYAFPLAYIVRTLRLPAGKIELLEGRQHFVFDGRPISLVPAHEVLEGNPAGAGDDDLPVVVVGVNGTPYGLVVDRFLGERELVVHPLDSRLGKVKDIAAAGLLEDGSPVLIVDVDDLIRSVERLVSGGRLGKVQRAAAGAAEKAVKRVLVVDDSLTVRELERKLLGAQGYVVEVAVDGMDGWNAVRSGHFNLVVTDVDMPRMDGIELVRLIKRDPALKALPVMIVSYKDREEDRQRGLEAGADYYLTKGSFHDETLIHAVVDLIGTANG